MLHRPQGSACLPCVLNVPVPKIFNPLLSEIRHVFVGNTRCTLNIGSDSGGIPTLQSNTSLTDERLVCTTFGYSSRYPW